MRRGDRRLSGSRYGIALIRLLCGLLQGIALYLLARAAEAKAWPATDPRVYDALIDIARYVPIYAIVSIGNLRLRTAAIWLAVLVVLCGGLGFYQGFRTPRAELDGGFFTASWLTYGFGLATLLFIGHSLVAAGDHDRRRIALFPTYFDIAWRLATQFLLSSLFVLLLWGILFLGASLFQAIGIDFFMRTFWKTWFWLPTTAMASSAALHLTDAHTALVRGARNLLLGLLSWLMPILTVIVAGFLLTLPFTGLEPLWKTRYAASSLLGAATILILLINVLSRRAAECSRVLTFMRLPAALLTPLVALAAAAWYGWTETRVVAVARWSWRPHAGGYVAALTSGACAPSGGQHLHRRGDSLTVPLADPAEDRGSRLIRAAWTSGAVDEVDFNCCAGALQRGAAERGLKDEASAQHAPRRRRGRRTMLRHRPGRTAARHAADTPRQHHRGARRCAGAAGRVRTGGLGGVGGQEPPAGLSHPGEAAAEMRRPRR